MAIIGIGTGVGYGRGGGGAISPLALFASGEQGAWFDPSDLSTLFQDTAGTTPVTAPGQTVALVLDKSKGLVLGPELVTNGTFDSGFTSWDAADGWSASGGTASTAAGSTGALQQSISLTAGKTYEISFTVSGWVSGGVIPTLFGGTAVWGPEVIGAGAKTVKLAAATGNTEIRFFKTIASAELSIDNVSVKELAGNHATQPTAAARPTYGVVPVPHIADDLVDDTLNWTAPAGTYTVAWVDTAGVVTIQTAQSLSGSTDALRAQNMAGYLAINRALTAGETADLTAWFQSQVGA